MNDGIIYWDREPSKDIMFWSKWTEVLCIWDVTFGIPLRFLSGNVKLANEYTGLELSGGVLVQAVRFLTARWGRIEWPKICSSQMSSMWKQRKGRFAFVQFYYLLFIFFPRRDMVTKVPYPAERSDKLRSEKMPSGLGMQKPCSNLRQNQSAERWK